MERWPRNERAISRRRKRELRGLEHLEYTPEMGAWTLIYTHVYVQTKGAPTGGASVYRHESTVGQRTKVL
jgi:hypothetical protein